eukprot:scaffold14914_cov82-Isochrysis_galbana.AAC.2
MGLQRAKETGPIGSTQRLVAYHEAGHAVMALLTPKFDAVSKAKPHPVSLLVSGAPPEPLPCIWLSVLCGCSRANPISPPLLHSSHHSHARRLRWRWAVTWARKSCTVRTRSRPVHPMTCRRSAAPAAACA